MASTLQTTLSSDFESTLAKFVTHGPLKTQDALEAAIFDLLIALQGAESEVPTLLLAVSSKIDGLLEAVITSRNDPAFTFRGRVLKTVQSISQPPDPAFSTCAERLGIFFFHLPRSITLDCSVITRHLSFSVRLASPDPLESEYLVIKRAKPVDPVLPKPARPVKVSKRKVRYVPLDLFTEDTPPVKNRSEAASQDEVEKPASSPVAGDFPAAAPSFIEQLKDCLESLFEILNPPTLAVQDPSARRSKPRGSDPKTPVVESPKLEARSRYGNTLAQHDLARYLGDTTKTPLGDWPVVVSQGAIKQVRRHSAGDQLTFSRIEKMMRQLSRGRFTESSHAKLLDKDHGVPIFTADVGGDLRLVYHIDFGAPADAGWESQFIRIFGVYPALKIDLDFWKAVSAHLSGRGDEYIRRTETPALSKPAKIVPPLVFRSLDASQGDQAGAVVEINEAHRLELHRILSLEKFIPLSHTFFDAIQKFNEASFMFTVSPHENQIIQHPSSCLVLGRSGTGKTTCMVFRMIGLDIAAKTSVSPQTLRQVFVTQSRTLARKVRLYCAQLMQTETNSALASAPKPPQGLSLLDMDENAEEEGALPKKFSQLDDCHFPLFVTYDQLCNLLEADFDLELIPSPLPTARTARAKNKKSSARQPLISFNYFDSKIWPHMDHRVKRGLHSALVYSEFMGIIKGSEASLSKPRHYLDQSEYEGQSNRSLPGDGTERSRVYTLFEAYRKLRPSASYDIADRTHLLMKILRDQGVPGKLIDFLYVDEAQDNLIIDSALLRTLCPNPHGLFFAGDTAQTISVGSAFRFSELKAFLYRLEREDVHVKRGGRPPVDPAFFQLSTNYRSHGGIVKAAAFIVSLLESYFQHSIDSLAPEVAHVDVATHRPLFFSGMRDHDELLKLISGSSDGQVELGAHQVIIVRHKEAAAALKAAIGRIGVVLTLYESKGMEFNDVLLYNFFTDSTATDTDWRALLLAQQEDRQFNSRKHSILQSELKSFYVGLTRARARVWVWEETYDSHPMENLLVNSGLATSYDPGETVERLVATNADDEWTEQAKEYFSKSLFLEAEFCFRQAKETWWADVAQAYDSRQDAMRLSEKHINRSTIFSQVAKTFERLVQEAKPTEDSESIRLLLSNAAECYSAIPDHVSAAHRFLQAGKETQAAYHFRMAGMFDEAIRVVERHTVDPDLAESIMYAAKFVFSSKKDPTSLHKARKLCADKEEFLEFLQDNGFEEQHVIFLDSITEHEEAAQVLWDTKDYVSAVTRFCQARTLSSRQKATRCLLEGLRANIPFATGYRNQPGIVSDLFKLTSDCEMSAEEKAEIDLLHAITNLQTADLDRYSQEYFEAGNIRCALLALDAWTQSGPLETIESATADQVADILLLCQKFGWVVNFLVRDTGFIDRPDIQTLFNISPTEQGMELEAQEIASQRVVQPRSFIFQRAVAACQPSGSQTNSITLPKNAVDDLVRRALLERMNALIEKVDTSSRTSRPFEICTKFLTAKSCTGHNDRSCWRDHISQKEITIQQFNTRFRLHLLCVALVDYWTAIDGSVDEERNRANKQK
ncbi:hypothetical protein FRC00_005249 [Tulasnella sp. 408]|nr:hypothetical protein FRC00_005249 [Tulasnella sp. 408]